MTTAITSIPIEQSDIDKVIKDLSKNDKLRPVKGGYIYGGKWFDIIDKLNYTEDKIKILLSLLHAEGKWTAINTYDNQIFTFGPGFSAKGDLPKFWGMLAGVIDGYEFPEVKRDLAQMGITINEQGVFKYKGARGLAAYRNLSHDVVAIKQLTNLFEGNMRHMEALQIATMFTLDALAMQIPDYAQDWPLSSKIACIHLAHWDRRNWLNPKYEEDFKNTNGDTVKVILTQYSIMDFDNAGPIKREPKQGAGTNPSTCMGTIGKTAGCNRILRWLAGDKIWNALVESNGAKIFANNPLLHNYLSFQQPNSDASIYLKKIPLQEVTLAQTVDNQNFSYYRWY